MRRETKDKLAVAGIITLLIAIAGTMAVLWWTKMRLDPNEPNTDRSAEQQRVETLVHDITYFEDHRTGLCFAYMYETSGVSEYRTGGPALATVPCPEVRALLVNP